MLSKFYIIYSVIILNAYIKSHALLKTTIFAPNLIGLALLINLLSVFTLLWNILLRSV